MKPGPKRICECGICRLCKHRKHGYRYYEKNAKRLSEKASENRRRRKGGLQNRAQNIPAIISTDADLDRRAAEWLANLEGRA